MLGERSDQRGLWEADRLYLDHVGKDTFYGLLASLRGQLFRDADFAEFYCADNGRDSVPPSLLARALLLQTHDKVSDAEAKARADFDIRAFHPGFGLGATFLLGRKTIGPGNNGFFDEFALQGHYLLREGRL